MPGSSDEINITPDEFQKISEALKKKEFRDLLAEYAREIQDPENKKRYEEEIRLMEAQRDVDVKFVNPSPGYVIKTSLDGNKKCFINVCTSDALDRATCAPSKKREKRGENWSIPYSLAPGREDKDKVGGGCIVYDCVFHPDTYKRGQADVRFKKLIEDTALQGVESQFNVKLDRVNLKYPKMKFKGIAQPTMIRTMKPGAKPLDKTSKEPLDFPYPYGLPNKDNSKPTISLDESVDQTAAKQTSTEPSYTVTHRGFFDMSTMTEAPDSRLTVTRPQELVIAIELPLLSSTKSVSLDVFPKRLSLHSEIPAAYDLDISLPYEVIEEKGTAKFDKGKHKLTITLPVVPPTVANLLDAEIIHPVESNLVEEITLSEAVDNQILLNDGSVSNGNSLKENEETSRKSQAATFRGDSLLNRDSFEAANCINDFVDNIVSSTTSNSVDGTIQPPLLNDLSSSVSVCSKETGNSFEDCVDVNNLPPHLLPQSMCSADSTTEKGEDAITGLINKEINDSFSANYKSSIPFFRISDPLTEKPFENLDGSFSGDLFNMPNVSIQQRETLLSIVLNEPGIFANKFSVKPFKENDGLHIKFASGEMGNTEVRVKSYYLYMEFVGDQLIDPESITNDINEDNAVILVGKASGYHFLWDQIKIGPCKGVLETVNLKAETESDAQLHRLIQDSSAKREMSLEVVESDDNSHRVVLQPVPGDAKPLNSTPPSNELQADLTKSSSSIDTVFKLQSRENGLMKKGDDSTRECKDNARDTEKECGDTEEVFTETTNKLGDVENGIEKTTKESQDMDHVFANLTVENGDCVDPEGEEELEGFSAHQQDVFSHETKSSRRRRKKQKNRLRQCSQSSDDGPTGSHTRPEVKEDDSGHEASQPINVADVKHHLHLDVNMNDPQRLESTGSSPSIVSPEDRNLRSLLKSHSSGNNATTDEESIDLSESPRINKSVSFCEDVDVVKIKPLPSKKNIRKHNKKMEKHAKHKHGSDENIAYLDPDKVKEHVTWNKVPLSDDLTFDFD